MKLCKGRIKESCLLFGSRNERGKDGIRSGERATVVIKLGEDLVRMNVIGILTKKIYIHVNSQ